MRNLFTSILSIVSLISLCFTSVAAEKYGLKDMHLNGRVKEVREYHMAGYNNHKKGNLSQMYRFDDNGNMIEERSYNDDGTLSGLSTYKYDSLNNRIEDDWYNVSPFPLTKYIFEYDTSNNLIKETTIRKDGLGRQIFYKYDSDNRKIEYSIQESPENPKTRTFRYKYDSNNNLIEEWYYGPAKRRGNDKTTYKYDSNSNKIKECRYIANRLSYRQKKKFDSDNNLIFEEFKYHGPNGKVVDRSTYRYDSNNNRIEKCDIYCSPIITYSRKETFKYDSNNKKIESCVYYDTLVRKTTFKFDANGNIIEECIYRYDGGISCRKKTYKYDSESNLIEKCDYSSDDTTRKEIDRCAYDSYNNKIRTEHWQSESFRYGSITEYEYYDSPKYGKHEYVDLGLPSGTLWAACNVGASRPEEFGDRFAWGETYRKDKYFFDYYEWCKSSISKPKRYFISSESGTADSLTTLLPEDDAATEIWGGEWRMPTREEQDELRGNCYEVFTDNYRGTGVGGVIFYKAKTPEDKGVFATVSGSLLLNHWDPNKTPSTEYSEASDIHIFLPAARTLDDGYSNDNERGGAYWSSSLGVEVPDDVTHIDSLERHQENAFYLYFDHGALGSDATLRCYGFSVRAVRVKKSVELSNPKPISWRSSFRRHQL